MASSCCELPTTNIARSHPPTDSDLTTQQVWTPGVHVPELDGVRGIAILMVTLYRFAKEFDPSFHPLIAFVRRCAPLGERGVELFFVLSGFLITGILIHTRLRPNYFRNFIVRRALRIFPLYFLTLIVCLFVIPLVSSTTLLDQPRREQLYLWTYTSNLRMSWLNDWCFGPLDHFWSLAVEEHFYLVWPVIVYWLSPKGVFRFCAIAIPLVFVVRTMAATRPELGVAVDVFTLFRCDALCIGSMLAVAIASGYSRSAFQRLAYLSLPILLVVAAAIAVTEKRFLAVPNTLCPIIFALILGLIAWSKPSDLLPTIARNSLLRWFGKYSYGMYVVQLPLVSLLPIESVVPTEFLSWAPVLACFVYLLGMVGLCAGVAMVSYHAIEERFLKLKGRFSQF